MLIRQAGGAYPAVDSTARVAENAALIGDVALAEDVTVWYGAVLRGDAGQIRVGAGSNIQDNCVLHCAAGTPTQVGRDVVVGHGAILHSCVVEDGCLIGMGAAILDGSVVGPCPAGEADPAGKPGDGRPRESGPPGDGGGDGGYEGKRPAL